MSYRKRHKVVDDLRASIEGGKLYSEISVQIGNYIVDISTILLVIPNLDSIDHS